MSAFPYCFLFFIFLHQTKVSTDEEINEVKPYENKCECCSVIARQLSELMDFVREVNSRLNNTEETLNQLKNEQNTSRDSTNVTEGDLEEHDAKDQQVPDDLTTANTCTLPSNADNGTRQTATNCVELGPRDCSDIRAMGFTASGVYRIYVGGEANRMQVDVYCSFNSCNESWLVFQRRTDGSENFERLYKEYESGFGNLSGEFWLGNEKLSNLTLTRKYKLRVDLEDHDGEKRFAEYSNFSVMGAKKKYKLTIGGYSGNAGDSLVYHNGMRFSTMNADYDGTPFTDCAKAYRGAWWYNSCLQSNLNGLYINGPLPGIAIGMSWLHWHGHNYSLKATEMKIAALV